MPSVAVVGGGVGGLTAAHELSERGFDVTVYEANDRFGGKARSVPVGEPPALHGEHGFRFFPAFYRHVVDTMDRIPTAHGTVADNLVETETALVASIDEQNRVAHTRKPQSVTEWLGSVRPAFAEDLPASDVQFVLERLLYLLTACETRRERDLDAVSWWEFIDAENRSEAFRDRLGYVTQSLVALRPEIASARTMGLIYLQLLMGQLDPTRPAERILNGPTSEAWIEPWTRHLQSQGVDLRPGSPVDALAFDGRRVTGVELADGSSRPADDVVLAVPVHVAPEFVTPALSRVAPELGRLDDLDTAWMNGIQFFLSEDVTVTRGHQVYRDAPWALTAISQRQFWTGFDFESHAPDGVEGVLSVIVSDWETPGTVHRKPARECTREEIAEEAWAQLCAHLDGEVSIEDRLVDWYLDPAIVETGDGVENRSPLLVNTVGSLRNRPPADTSVENLAVAGDYVRTNSDLASMESACEAGRRAANAVLDRHDSPAARAEVWELEEPALFAPFRRQDRIRYRLGLPHPAEVTQSLRSVTNRLRGSV